MLMEGEGVSIFPSHVWGSQGAFSPEKGRGIVQHVQV